MAGSGSDSKNEVKSNPFRIAELVQEDSKFLAELG